MLVGVLLAVRQTDMKLILAYTTTTALGSLVFLLGSTHYLIVKAAVAFLLAHALYKATLFMTVGDIKHQTGIRDIDKVRGLHKAMSIAFMAVLVAGASMPGLPPLFIRFLCKRIGVWSQSRGAVSFSYLNYYCCFF